MTEIFDVIRSRRSVRTFNGKAVDAALLNELKEYGKTVTDPWNIPVEFVYMDARAYGLYSPVLSGEPMYIAAKVKKTENSEAAVGYAFEKLMLKAVQADLGTVWIGGTMKREEFEKACGKADDERMPCITPLGYPAKMSFKETMMRKGVGADKRLPKEKLFFENDWNTPYVTDDSMLFEALEAVRLAPSAVNKQPWRILYKDGMYHFYEKKNKGYVSEEVGDMQKIDIGIAMAHFDLIIEAYGKKTEMLINEPAVSKEADMEYIASLRIL